MNQSDILMLAEILIMINKGSQVKWSEDGGDTIRQGTARHIVKSPDNIGFLGFNEDVLTGYLRITTITGLAAFLPMTGVLQLRREGLFTDV